MISHPIRNRAIFASGVICFLIFFLTTAFAADPPASSKDLLDTAAQQINAKDYLAAKETLEQVKPVELTPADKKRLVYLNERVDYSLAKATEVRQSMEKAEQLAQQNDFIAARQTLEKAFKSAKNDPAAQKMINTKLAEIRARQQRFEQDMKELFRRSIKVYDAGQLDQAERGFRTVVDSGIDLGFWNRGKPQKYLQKIADKKAKLTLQPPAQPELKPITTIVVEPTGTPSEPVVGPIVTAPAPSALETPDVFRQRNQALVRQELAYARAALTSRRFDQVLVHTKNVLAVSPDNAQAQELQAEAMRYTTAVTPGRSLIAEEVKRRRILTEQISLQHQVAMDRARQLVQKHKFAEARVVVQDAQAVLKTHQSILHAYNMAQMNAVGEATLAHVDQEERIYQTAQIEDEHRRAEAQAQQALAIAQQQRDARVTELSAQAQSLVQERRYKQALDRYHQILTIDPNNPAARSMALLMQDKEWVLETQDRHRETQLQKFQTFQQVDEASTPYSKELTWDENWPELSKRRWKAQMGIISDSSENVDAQRRLSARHPHFEYQDDPLSEVFDDLREKSGLNIMPNWQSLSAEGIERTQTITLTLRNVSVERVLKAILDSLSAGFYAAPITYILDEGVVVIASSNDLGRDFYTVVYDISDLMVEIRDRRGGSEFAPGGGGTGGGRGGTGGGTRGGRTSGGRTGTSRSRTGTTGGAGDIDQQREELVEKIEELVISVAPADSWEENGGQGTVNVWGNRLIVSQSAENQTKIGGMINQIRETRPVQISVEPRFIFVTDNFLEDIGVDLDFFLNPQGRWVGPDSRPTFPPAWPHPGFRAGFPAPVVAYQAGTDWSLPPGTGVPGSLGGGVGPTAITIAGSFLDKLEVDFFLRATQASQQATTLTAPRITFENGSGGRIYVGREFWYVSEVDPDVEENAVGYEITTEILETGPTLDVMGVVSPDRRFVRLEIDISLYDLVDMQTLADLVPGIIAFAPELSLTQLPVMDTTTITTQVSVPDGGALLIGGLKRSGEATREVGVPLLDKVPWLNRFFTNKSMVEDKHVLVILLRPRIIDLKESQGLTFPMLGEK